MRKARVIALLVAGTVATVDQLTKMLVVSRLELRERVSVIPRYFDLTYVTNPGGVWSVGADLSPGLRTAVFLALPGIITVFAIWFSLSLPPRAWWRQAAIACVVGGAVGNLIDRLFRTPPEVVDFLLAHWRDQKHWPAFNVADAAICVGVAILLVASFTEDDEDEDLAPEAATASLADRARAEP